jgi:hypothetical protein
MSSAEKPLEKVTRTGSVLGTPHYMAPEQASGRTDVDHRLDIYTFGVVLFECLTGRLPFPGDNYNQVLTRIITEPFPRPSEIDPLVHPKLDEVILKATARRREDRYQSADEMAAALLPLIGAEVRQRLAGPGPCKQARVADPAKDHQPAEDRAVSLDGRVTEGTSATRRRRSRRTWPVVLAATVLMVVVAGLAVWRPWDEASSAGSSISPPAKVAASTPQGESSAAVPASAVPADQAMRDEQTLAELERMRNELAELRGRLDTAERSGAQDEAQTIKAQIEATERAQEALTAPISPTSVRPLTPNPATGGQRSAGGRRTPGPVPHAGSGGSSAASAADVGLPAADSIDADASRPSSAPALAATSVADVEVPPEYLPPAVIQPPVLPDVPADGVVRQTFESARSRVAACLGPSRRAVAAEATILGATGEVTAVRMSGALPEDDASPTPATRWPAWSTSEC